MHATRVHSPTSSQIDKPITMVNPPPNHMATLPSNLMTTTPLISIATNPPNPLATSPLPIMIISLVKSLPPFQPDFGLPLISQHNLRFNGYNSAVQISNACFEYRYKKKQDGKTE